jgi:hypothetical protein
MVGVLVFSVAEMGGGSVESAIRKAAERSGERLAKERAGAPWNLAPYPGVAGAWSWTVSAASPTSGPSGSAVSIVPRWYLPATDTWIAQFRIGVPPDMEPDRFVTDVLKSLTTSREPRCYETRLRELGGIR